MSRISERLPRHFVPRLGWTQEQIAEIVGISQGRVAQIINNTNFGEINNLLTQGRDMEYIASHYHMDIATRDNRPEIQYHHWDQQNNDWPRFNKRLWQRNYYEHIICNEKSYDQISEYIQTNPHIFLEQNTGSNLYI